MLQISAEELVEIKKLRKENKNKRVEQILKVLVLRAEGRSNREISRETGYNERYGSMVHTAFFDEKDYQQKYEEMKQELASFIDRMDSLNEDERSDFYGQFCDKY